MSSKLIEVTETSSTYDDPTFINPIHIVKIKSIQLADDTECTEIFMASGVGLHVKQTVHQIRDRFDGYQER